MLKKDEKKPAEAMNQWRRKNLYVQNRTSTWGPLVTLTTGRPR
ncbi:hypothetical protein ARMA_0285 [Ardenticatena maritima]|uniref:Uncharacterized protein n=1 Tax=Ardenticatena maritima TaxID=872965 RepID=A0A0M8K6Q8_9CHLR|nr:hypothetical protein ARMA_0285 [Ardenticatena maritima]